MEIMFFAIPLSTASMWLAVLDNRLDKVFIM